MTPQSRMDPSDFVARVKPLLVRQDLGGLLGLLRANWTSRQICDLLSSESCDARKVAALALALVGDRECVEALAGQLRHPDPMVNQMAEHALWNIWFRLGAPEANHQLHCGTLALDRREYDHATEHFTHAIELDPTFAEAYNQRALVAYLRERYEDCIEDCLQVVERMPCHFGAWAGMGHGYAHLGEIPSALESYRQALDINPHLTCLREAVEELQRQSRQ